MKRIIFILIILSFSLVFSQTKNEVLKRKALLFMQSKRYGEAIDLLNKYVSTNARVAEGYNLRALCFEKREEYSKAFFDLRIAIRLEPKNKEYWENFSRVKKVWFEILRERIEGYKREIAIDPSNPFNYLEIGKSYRWMEEWEDAELWYDKYLARDENASPDEIIRYTIILTELKHIRKGERILKKWVEKYPEDWRLWSRYGYFTLWLGKYRTAGKAFEEALKFKPFFKEAMDGLDLARKKGYLVQMGYDNNASKFEYPIDKYNRLLKKDPNRVDWRFKLIDELIKHNRLGEASENVNYILDNFSDDEKISARGEKYEALIDSIKNSNIEKSLAEFEKNKNDEKAVLKLADSYVQSFYYDKATEILKAYIDSSEASNLVKFKYAQYSAWNYDWESAIKYLDELIELEPDNAEYKLLRGQIAVWTVQDLDLAKEYLGFVLEKNPKNMPALISLIQLYAWEKDFENADKYFAMAKEIDPDNKDLKLAESNLEMHRNIAKELKILAIRTEAQQLALDGDYEGALEKYDEYFSKIDEPKEDEMKQYASINLALKNYETALEYYNRILENSDSPEIKLLKAKTLLWMGNGEEALPIFEEVVKEDTLTKVNLLFYSNALAKSGKTEKADSILTGYIEEVKDTTNDYLIDGNYFNTKLFIADTYAEMKDFDEAEDLYEEMLVETSDSTEINTLKQRLDWIPHDPSFIESAFYAILPNHLGVNPWTSAYRDNVEFFMYAGGVNLDLGLNRFLGIGGSFGHYHLESGFFSSNYDTRNLNKLTGNINLIFHKNLTASVSYGVLNTQGEKKENIYGGTVKYENNILLRFSYDRTDSRIVLFSPYLLHTDYKIDFYNLGFELKSSKIIYLGWNYKYLKISDGNKGNNFLLKIGKKFFDKGYLGYEYYFDDYGRVDKLYYSPQDYNQHSIWTKFLLYNQDNWIINGGGKLGYSPSVDFNIMEAWADARYKFSDYFSFVGKLTFGRSFRYDTTYDFVSFNASVYWSVK